MIGILRKSAVSIILFSATGGMQAQTANIEYSYYGMYQFIPKSMTTDGNVRLVTKSTEGSNGTAKANITVYGSDFEKEKTITNNVRITSTGNKRTRRATSATISASTSQDITSEIEQRVSPDNMDGSVTADDLIEYGSLTGDVLSMTADGYYYSSYCYNFYGGDVFGQRYPRYFIELKDGKAYQVTVTRYVPDFTDSQWQSSSWTYYENVDDIVCSFRLHDLDEDKGYTQSESLILTQSLFNDDDKYEYIRTLRKEGASGGGSSSVVDVTPSDNEQSPIETETIDESNYGIGGYEIVAEDGTVVFTIEIDDKDVHYYAEGAENDNVMVVKMNGELYFIVTTTSYSSSNTNKMLIYKLDKKTSSAKKLVTSNDIIISPRVVSKSQPVNISFKKAISADSNVIVTSLDGKVMAKRTVKAGETSVDISTSGMAAGLYNFTVINKGKVVENGKVIVK